MLRSAHSRVSIALALSMGLTAPALGAQCEVFGAVAAGASSAADVGSSVSISGDVMFVGAPSDAVGGAAYVFERIGGTWTQVDQLTASDASAGDGFGRAVSVHGSVAVVGAPFDDPNGQDSGSAYVFEKVGGTWVETEKVVSSDNSFGDFLGIGVSAGAGRVVVGGCQFLKFLLTGGLEGNGAVYVFEPSGADWLETAKLEAADGAPGDRFGVAVHHDGDRIVSGAEDDDDFGESSGTAYVFDYQDPDWVFQQKLVPNDSAAGHIFGFAVDVDGDRTLIGAIGADNGVSASGAAYLFETAGGGVWTQAKKLVASNGASDDRFGDTVALDGERALVGAPHGSGDVGSAHLFERSGGAWPETDVLLATGNAAGVETASGVALDGDTLALGSPAWGDGAVHVWSVAEAGCPDLFTWPPSIDTTTGGVHGFTLRAGAGQAGDLYIVNGTISGTAPGFSLGGAFVVPLNPDAYFLLTLTSTPIVGGVAFLDGDGVGHATLPVPGNPALGGLDLHHAFVAVDPLTFQVHSISGATGLELL